MNKKLLIIMSTVTFIMVMPGIVQASENNKSCIATGPGMQEVVLPGVTKYAACETGIYELPDENSYIYDYANINTSFEVVDESDDWSKIITQDGFAYIKSCDLSATQIIIIEKRVNTYSDDDLYIMAHVLAGECQSCPNEEQLYVGSVVLNRVAHSEFPNTISEVVFQKGQYACTWDGNYYRDPTDRNWENARYLLENGSVLPENVIWQSGRKQGKGVYVKTKWHYYCY